LTQRPLLTVFAESIGSPCQAAPKRVGRTLWFDSYIKALFDHGNHDLGHRHRLTCISQDSFRAIKHRRFWLGTIKRRSSVGGAPRAHVILNSLDVPAIHQHADRAPDRTLGECANRIGCGQSLTDVIKTERLILRDYGEYRFCKWWPTIFVPR
jgi:hypothetical protein